jgi:glycosyltransferase involved in cell wall biosynthesis
MDAPKILKIMMVASDMSGPMYHVLFLPSQYFNKFNLLQTKIVVALDQALAESSDIIAFQRQYTPECLMWLRMAKKQGKVVCTNVDDNIWELPPNNPAKSVYTKDNLARYEQILREVNATTTSTPYLKKLTLPFNKNCYVERNLVEPFLNEFVSIGKDLGSEDTVRIGWWLTPHHADDAEIIRDVVPAITKKYVQVKWIMMGWLPPFVATLPRNRYEYYEFVKVDAFYPALASLDIDIAIAPLVLNGFNRGKTGRKSQEAAILGMPMVLSPISTYSNWKTDKTCIKPVTNDTKGWIDALSYLVENEPKREEIARAAYHYVLENHNIDTHIAEHAAIFYDIYNKAKGTDLKVPGFEDKVWDFTEAERVQNEEEASKL